MNLGALEKGVHSIFTEAALDECELVQFVPALIEQLSIKLIVLL